MGKNGLMSVMNSAKYFSRDALRSLPEVLVEWRRARPRTGVVFLLPEVEQARVAAIQAAGREADVPVIGAIFPALLGSEGFLTEGAWALCYDPMPPWFLIDRPDPTLTPPSNTPHGKPHGTKHSAKLPKWVCI